MRSKFRHRYTLRNISVAAIISAISPMLNAVATADLEQGKVAVLDQRSEQFQGGVGVPVRTAKLPDAKEQAGKENCVMIFDRALGITHQLAYFALKRGANAHSTVGTAIGLGCGQVLQER